MEYITTLGKSKNERYLKQTQNFGIGIPNNMEGGFQIDKKIEILFALII